MPKIILRGLDWVVILAVLVALGVAIGAVVWRYGSRRYTDKRRPNAGIHPPAIVLRAVEVTA